MDALTFQDVLFTFGEADSETFFEKNKNPKLQKIPTQGQWQQHLMEENKGDQRFSCSDELA